MHLQLEKDFKTHISAARKHRCHRCGKFMPAVIKINGKLICVACRAKDVGISAIYEPLYDGFNDAST